MTTPYAQDLPQELLLRIFVLLDYRSNARNARVCKAWKDGALDEVWRHMCDWTSALASLAGTVPDPDTQKIVRPLSYIQPLSIPHRRDQSFLSPLSKSIWDRFFSNSHRVRYIDGTNRPASHIHWSERAMIEIMATRPLAILFPNLQSLRIGACSGPQFGAIIMHDSVSALTIDMRLTPARSTPIDFTTLCLHVSERMPSLTTLELDIAAPDDQTEHALCLLFERLPYLRDVTLSPMLFFPSIINPLSTIHSLRALMSQSAHIEWVKAPRNFQAPLEAGAFPSLQSITFGSSLDHARQFFTAPNFPTSSLIYIFLYVPLPHHKTSSHLQQLLISLADSCRSLERLELYMTEIDNLRMSIQDARNSPVYTFADICPILRLQNLKVFIIRYVHPIFITDDEIESLAASLPHLEELVLNAYPMITPKPTLTLRAIVPFALHCPRLTKLALYLRCTLDNVPPSLGAHFDHLAQLCIGCSTVLCNVETVSWFLFPLLPRVCEVLASVDEDCDEFLYVAESAWWETEPKVLRDHAIRFWQNVRRALELMHKVKEDGERPLRSRIGALEEELRVVHARLEELEP